MRALIRRGESKSLTLVTDYPDFQSDPELDPSKFYTIRTHAIALTRGELTWPEPLSVSTPIQGYDIAGTILSVPTQSGSAKLRDGGPTFKPGDEVYALTDFARQGNGLVSV